MAHLWRLLSDPAASSDGRCAALGRFPQSKRHTEAPASGYRFVLCGASPELRVVVVTGPLLLGLDLECRRLLGFQGDGGCCGLVWIGGRSVTIKTFFRPIRSEK